MKTIKVISGIVLISIMLVQPFNLIAQNCVCALCNISCSSLASAHTNSSCPVYKSRVANSGSGTTSSGKSMETAIMGAILQSMLFSSKINSAKSAEEKLKLEREEQKRNKQLAIEQENLKRYNDYIAQVNHDKMMKDYKKLDDGGELSYKGLDKEKKWKISTNLNCKISSFKGEVSIFKSTGTVQKLTTDQSVNLTLGDWIYTGKNSWLKLHYEFEKGGKDMILGQNSFMNIVTNEEGTNIPNLVKGRTYVTNSVVDDISVKIKEDLISWRGKFEVRTPTAICGIRGTTFSITQDSLIGTSLIVTKGTVELKGLLIEQMIIIEAGYKGIVTPLGEILGPIKIEEAEIKKWWEE